MTLTTTAGADLEEPATGATGPPTRASSRLGRVPENFRRRPAQASFCSVGGPEPEVVVFRTSRWRVVSSRGDRAPPAAAHLFLIARSCPVASFVNHDIVFVPGMGVAQPSPPLDPPHVPAAPAAIIDRPAAQVSPPEAYYSGYGLTYGQPQPLPATRSSPGSSTTACAEVDGPDRPFCTAFAV